MDHGENKKSKFILINCPCRMVIEIQFELKCFIRSNRIASNDFTGNSKIDCFEGMSRFVSWGPFVSIVKVI